MLQAKFEKRVDFAEIAAEWPQILEDDWDKF
jgi:hypothetical protein